MPTRPAIPPGVLRAAPVFSVLAAAVFAGGALANDRAVLRVSVLVVAPCEPPPSGGPADPAACSAPDAQGPVVLGRRFLPRPSATVPSAVRKPRGG